MTRISSIKQQGKGKYRTIRILSQYFVFYQVLLINISNHVRAIKLMFPIFRYVYRFVCDLQSLLGYSADELHSMVELGKLIQQQQHR